MRLATALRLLSLTAALLCAGAAAAPVAAQSWAPVTTLPGDFVQSVYADAAHVYAVVFDAAANTNLIYRSSDGGAAWTRVPSPDPNSGTFVFQNVWTDEATPEDDIFSFGNGGLIRTLDGGATWARAGGFSTSNVFDMVKVGGQYLVTTVNVFGPGGILSSTDGLSWTLVPSPATSVRDIIADAGTILASYFNGANDLGVIRSTDGGATWTETLSGQGYQRLVRTPSGVIAGGSGTGTWYRSTDDGVTWAPDAPLLFDTIAAAAEGNVVALLSGTILTSTDGGATLLDGSASAPASDGPTTCFTDVAVSQGSIFATGCVGASTRAASDIGFWVLPLLGTASEAAPRLGDALALYPNPTTGTATVTVALGTPGPVRVQIYDALGRLVHLLADAQQAAGPQSWTTPALAPGLYVVRAETAAGFTTARLTVTR